jgi:D-alanyl-D-alanine dipeptidase
MLTKTIKRLVIVCLIINIAAILIIGIGVYSYAVEDENVEVVVADITDNKKKEEPQSKKDFINIREYIPDIVIELHYATIDNITGKKQYNDDEAYLRRGTADKLKRANDELMKYGFRIKIWDAYRPTAVQYELWKKVPDTRYIANPKRGSIHSRGAAVDITLVDKDGKTLEMPTGFDSFSLKADRDYSDISPKAAEMALILQSVMEKYGFLGAETEWWHYSDADWKEYPQADRVVLSSKIEKFNIEIAAVEDEDNKSSTFASNFFSIIGDEIEKIDVNSIVSRIKDDLFEILGYFSDYRI